MHSVLIWLSIGAGFLSGALWFYAAIIKVPTNFGSGYGALVGVEEMTAGFKKQAIWNSSAAAATAIATVLQAVAMMTVEQ